MELIDPPYSFDDKPVKMSDRILDVLTQVEPLFKYPSDVSQSFELYLQSLQALIRRILPLSLIEFAKTIQSIEEEEKIEEFYQQIISSIPTSSWSQGGQKAPYILSIVSLCQSHHTHGVGRFLCDIYSRWTVPGKLLPLVYVHSMAFCFKAYPSFGFFIHELFAEIDNKKDLLLAHSLLPNLVKEVNLNISAVAHTRKIVALKPLTLEQKRIIIQENISSLLNRPSRAFDINIFDQMQHLLIKASAEERMTQIRQQIAPLLEYRPQFFDRDIFQDVHSYVTLFQEKFISDRDPKTLARIIAYSHLFSKLLSHQVLNSPNQRHVVFKIIHTHQVINDARRKCIGLLVGINLLRENEILTEKHLFKAIQSILPDALKVSDSSFIDRKSTNNVKILYLEIYKKDGYFTLSEMILLRRLLAREIKMRIESVINPIFMPKNDEEIMRNILTLSKQLKSISDIPQVIINFHKQTDSKIAFTVIMLRVQKSEDPPLQQLFQSCKPKIKLTNLEVKSVGLLQKKYTKEASVFDIHLEKRLFLRNDFSLDLNMARKFVHNILSNILGEVRDYNGGMISKQGEALAELKRLLFQLNIQNDFLLENFFYSLTPNYMQSIINPNVLKKLFLLILEALEHDFSKQIYFLKTQIVEDYFLLSIAAINPTFKDFIEQRLENADFESLTLTQSFVNIYDISCLSYLLKFNDSDQHQHFLQSILESVKIWKTTMQKNMNTSFFPEFIIN